MGFFSNLFGHSSPPKANLDNLFAVPSAAITLQVSSGFTPTGVASVCYREAEGGAFAATETEVQQLLDADQGPKVQRTTDDFGFTWLICRNDPDRLPDLITDVHAVNTSLEGAGFSASLLCTLVVFADADQRKIGLVYLYKQGTFYPFAPSGHHERNNALELQIRGELGNDVTIEPDLNRWMAIWGAPGL